MRLIHPPHGVPPLQDQSVPDPTHPHSPSNWLLIDLGGTHISHRLGGITQQERTPRTKATCLALIQSWIKDLNPVGCALAVPGLLDQNGVVTPGSAANLSDQPGDWDGFGWHDWLATMGRPYHVMNDALAALVGGVSQDAILHSPTPVMVGYIGPGTGLGGGFVSVCEGEITVIGDGHLYDVWLPRDLHDPWRTGSRVMAEDVLSGRGYQDVMGRSLADGNIDPLYPELMGRYLRALVGCLQSGYPIDKKGPAWSRSTCDAVSLTRRWYLGGGILGHEAIRCRVMAHWPPDHQVAVWGSSVKASLDGLGTFGPQTPD